MASASPATGQATVELTTYTGVAAFNIGFGAQTACSAFHIFPNAMFKKELKGEQFRALEKQWENAVLLIVDEVSFIGRAFFHRMHCRLQRRRASSPPPAGLSITCQGQPVFVGVVLRQPLAFELVCCELVFELPVPELLSTVPHLAPACCSVCPGCRGVGPSSGRRWRTCATGGR